MDITKRLTYSGLVLASLALQGISMAADQPLVESFESPYGFSTTVVNLEKAVKANNFKLIRSQPIDEGMGTLIHTRGQVIYFCNFSQLHSALQKEKRIGFLLPCRFTVTEADGKVNVHYVNPERTVHFSDDTLKNVCNHVQQAYRSIVDEALM